MTKDEMMEAIKQMNVIELSDLVKALEEDMVRALEGWSLEPVVRGLRALRGVDLVVGMTVMAELGDLTRFDAPTQAAWRYRFPARKTPHLQRRAEQTTQQVQEIAWRAQKKLCGRYRHLTERGKPAGKVITALGRELLGFIWAIAWETMPTKTA